MKKYTIPFNLIPLDDSWDVIVAGGGPAGCTAAASAAREGARTLLVEATGCLGGMGTSGLVPAWCPFTDQERIIYSGMAEKVLRQTMAGMPHVNKNWFDWVPIDAERLKRVYDDLMLEHGVHVLFDTFVAAVGKQGADRIDAVITASKSGLRALKAGIYVDCTGDADLAAWAGAKFEKGDEEGDLQPATLCFVLSNVDMYGYQHCGRLRTWDGTPQVMDAILASGKYPLIPDLHACNNIVGPGTVGFNAGHLWSVDNTDPTTVSEALMKGRKIASAFRDALAEFSPKAYANAFLVNTGSLMGIRETRRIIGDYCLTLRDFIERRTFKDEICRNCYYIDVHHKKSEVASSNKKQAGGKAPKSIRMNKGESHGIPYRCLTPRGLANVLVAGRSISTDRAVQGSTRVMPVCLAMGEAAGMAAAMAAKRGGDTRKINVATLRKRLKKEGAYLPV